MKSGKTGISQKVQSITTIMTFNNFIIKTIFTISHLTLYFDCL